MLTKIKNIFKRRPPIEYELAEVLNRAGNRRLFRGCGDVTMHLPTGCCVEVKTKLPKIYGIDGWGNESEWKGE